MSTEVEAYWLLGRLARILLYGAGGNNLTSSHVMLYL